MSTAWWISAYVVVAAFLGWIAYGRGLKTVSGGVLALLLLDAHEPLSDRGLRRVAQIGLALVSLAFAAGLLFPEWRSG